MEKKGGIPGQTEEDMCSWGGTGLHRLVLSAVPGHIDRSGTIYVSRNQFLQRSLLTYSVVLRMSIKRLKWTCPRESLKRQFTIYFHSSSAFQDWNTYLPGVKMHRQVRSTLILAAVILRGLSIMYVVMY